MITGQQIIDEAMKHIGKKYVYGAEANDKQEKDFDCSELVEFVCRKLGVQPPVRDGAQAQWVQCSEKNKADVEKVRGVAGALVFRYDKTKKKMVHVGFTVGDGRTFEARGSAYNNKEGVTGVKGGVNIYNWRNSWTHAAYIPGVIYNK